MNINHLKLITFDVTNTLLKFKVSPWQYYTEIAKDHGFYGTEDNVKAKFTDSYKTMCKKYPNYGKTSIAWESWWSQLVKMTLKDYLPVTADLDAIAKKLINEFKTTKCWSTADGADKLVRHLKKLNMTIGVISNSDPRLYDILQNISMDKSFDFIVTSYDLGYSKPDERIFKEAINMSKQSVKPSECLHIGDDLKNDYEGARTAGWHAILINNNISPEISPAPEHVFNSLEDLYLSINQNRLKL